jgi:hypothetical protein
MATTQNVEAINDSASLVTMEGTKLKLMPGLNISNPSVRVVSIVGKARMGKSTFLNAFVSKCAKMNKVVFTTNSGVKHCTFGINYCFIPEHNILLLDSQGLANGDARHDPALLLFIYLVSNVVIFNDSKILQNEALKLLEPICTFATYINDFDSFAKPALIFRLSDGKLVENTDENLQQVMEHHPDQYQSIRESIEEVFLSPIQLVKTETLDRKDERFLDNGDYLGLLAEPENGFAATIDYIMQVVNKSEPRLNILSRLPEIVEQINNNEKISLEKLDVVGLVHKNDLLEWLQTVSPHLKTPIEVDGTQLSYLAKVVKRQQEVDAKLKEFDKRFKSVSANIKREQKKKLKAELDEPINKATADSKEISMKKVKAQVESLQKFTCNVSSSTSSFINKDLASIKLANLSGFSQLKDACVSFFSPVKAFYDSWVTKINEDFTKCVEECRAQESAERAALQKYCDGILAGYNDWLIEQINALKADNSCVHVTNTALFKKWSDAQVERVREYIKTHMNVRSATLSVQAQELKYTIVPEKILATTHDLVADIYVGFLAGLQSFNNDKLDKVLCEKKETLLYGVLFTNPADGKAVYDANPDIEMVHDSFLLGIAVLYKSDVEKAKMPYMTMRTWTHIYEPLYNEALTVLISDGVCAPDSDFLFFISKEVDKQRGLTIVTGHDTDELYENHVREFLSNEMKKIYCRRRVHETAVCLDL